MLPSQGLKWCSPYKFAMRNYTEGCRFESWLGSLARNGLVLAWLIVSIWRMQLQFAIIFVSYPLLMIWLFHSSSSLLLLYVLLFSVIFSSCWFRCCISITLSPAAITIVINTNCFLIIVSPICVLFPDDQAFNKQRCDIDSLRLFYMTWSSYFNVVISL